MKRFWFQLALLIAALVLLAPLALTTVDRLANRSGDPGTDVDPSIRAFHDSLWVADFHNDALLWNRNILERANRGQLDLPRLIDGGVELAVFSATTRFYLASNYHRTLPFVDVLPLTAMISGWPVAAWFDPFARALAISEKLHAAARDSHGRLRVVTTRQELADLVRARERGDTLVGGVLLLEGLHAIDGRMAYVDSLFASGYRVFGIAHMFDNTVGGSAHGWEKGGLTPLGRRVVAHIDSLGGILDLAHASPATIDDVLSVTSRPVVVSHTGIASTCSGPRNLPDEVVARIAARGGMVAIGFWPAAVCGDDAAAIARAIHRAIDVAGDTHVALGSDFDGAVRTPFDVSRLPVLTAALLDEGLTRAQIRAVMGENEKRFLLEMLPDGQAPRTPSTQNVQYQ